jgi:hypothetical protein
MLSFMLLVGCDDTTDDNGATPAPGNETPTPNNEGKDGDATTITKIGLGHVNSIAKSKDFADDVLPFGQVDTIIAAVAFGKNDKIVKVSIDSAQQKITFDKEMKITTDLAKEQVTKVELGDEYGMIAASKIGKNWYEQIAELEKWMIGKTINEISSLKTKQVDESHPSVPDIPELTSLVTITVQDYIAAVEEAYENAVNITEGASTFGLGHNIKISGSKSLADNVTPVAAVDTTMAATAFDNNGKVVGTIIDVMQTKVNFDAEGKVTNRDAILKSKIEIGDEYGLIAASGIKKNWHEQIAELEKWMVGKTVKEIKAMKTVERDSSHPAVPDEPDLTSLVTITVQDYIAAVEEGQENAK